MEIILYFVFPFLLVFSSLFAYRLTKNRSRRVKECVGNNIHVLNGNDENKHHTVSAPTEKTQTILPVEDKIVPISVNYHFTRKCNYSCGFCFHTAKTSFVLPLETAKKGLAMLKDAGNVVLNIFSIHILCRKASAFM